MNNPILIIAFNRPKQTKTLLESIKKVKPDKLYFAIDGPRKGNKNDIQLINEVKSLICKIDWECDIKTLFRNNNLGCKYAVSSSIDWFFKNEDQGIILEDDCIPNDDFFTFCDTLLTYYKDNDQIMSICGSNFQNGIKRGNGSYYFSKLNDVWGWATWRRAWINYDVEMRFWPELKISDSLKHQIKDDAILKYYEYKFDRTYLGDFDTWDYQWTACIWKMNGISIIPNSNLITNIGFDNHATHTKKKDHKLANLKLSSLTSIIHPEYINIDTKADSYTFNFAFNGYLHRKPLIYFLRLLKSIKILFNEC